MQFFKLQALHEGRPHKKCRMPRNPGKRVRTAARTGHASRMSQRTEIFVLLLQCLAYIFTLNDNMQPSHPPERAHPGGLWDKNPGRGLFHVCRPHFSPLVMYK